MELNRHVQSLREQLAVAASAGGDEARALADRLTASLDAAVRLTLLEALTAAAEEITRELAPGSVELRLRAEGPEFVVTPPPAESGAAGDDDDPPPAADEAYAGEGNDARINLRLPEQLKARVEQAAERSGLSVNSWLVRAVAAVVERGGPGGS
ncbi:MAG: hypothetical protein QOD86_2897, partial [Miltoncostaeaceae bacterium]|nr:hypothetical protein [Miltoncostaeaceae bacterium]